MKPFFQVKTSQEIIQIIENFPALSARDIPLEQGLNRVLAQEIISPEDLPHFPRATMDGFALRARDTFGASEAVPALLTLSGEIAMGQEVTVPVQPGHCFRIATGGMLPPGADAVAMIEYSQPLDERMIEIFKPLSPLDHVIQAGEDIKEGQSLLQTGQRLRPQDLGILAGLGIETIPVHHKPKVAIISTGDEIVPINQKPSPGFIRDINSITLMGQVKESGAIPLFLGRTKDHFGDLEALCRKGLEEADVVLISGGSSVGARDFTLEVIHSFAAAEVLAHGISISPGKPTILARIGNKILWGLPGHVASAMIVFTLFVKPCLNHLEGEAVKSSVPRTTARLTRNVPSAQGREDYIRVSLEPSPEGWLAAPIFGKSGILSTLVRADGIIRIDQHCEGLEKGESVEIIPF
ncbi:MAG TPA: gephyrin-like molybdotransferase Glp [Thermodesulfobacteriota bacterium]|nr:gephyrin-like molybdotransferase Glp [Thermodesulfobacteriota bacterium]